MFSVIIPLHNKEKYIENCIQSVFSQSFTNFELIVVNDGSTDLSPSVAQQILRENSQSKALGLSWHFISQPKSGASAARNSGARLSRFEYLAFLDADDWWHPEFLRQMADLVSLYPEAGLLGSNYFYVKNHLHTIEDKGIPPGFTHGYIDYFSLFARKFIVPINCSFVIVRKKEFLESGGFNPSLRFGEDCELWIRIALRSKVAYLNRPLAFSNQDVSSNNRMLGHFRKWKPNEHFAFCLHYPAEVFEEFPSLKLLTDGIKIRKLLPFKVKNWYPEEVRKILKDVNFNNHPYHLKLLHKSPRWLAGFLYSAFRILMIIRKKFLRRSNSRINEYCLPSGIP